MYVAWHRYEQKHGHSNVNDPWSVCHKFHTDICIVSCELYPRVPSVHIWWRTNADTVDKQIVYQKDLENH